MGKIRYLLAKSKFGGEGAAGTERVGSEGATATDVGISPTYRAYVITDNTVGIAAK